MAEDFDVIVVGSGISGGWAAKEFCEKGFKTLVIERGRHVEHGEDYIGENKDPWEMKFRDRVDRKLADQRYPRQKRCYAFKDSTKHFFNDDVDYPYSVPEGRNFEWIRGHHLGGRSLLWHRQSYRWSDMDFSSNARDGYGTDWPVRYKDMAPWYDYVEEFVGISGTMEGMDQLPDGKFLPPIGFNCAEEEFAKRIEKAFDDRRLIPGRCAHLTEPTEVHMELGRGTCQSRNQCQRGCSLGAYFSSQSATLPAADRTGNMTIATDSIVHSIIYDDETKRASGVRVVDANTMEGRTYSAKVIFLCASTLGTAQVLLNSTSEHFQNGFANSSDAVGRYLMDHLAFTGATGELHGFQDHYYIGRKPNSIYLPRFTNLERDEEDFLRGYAYQGGSSRLGWSSRLSDKGFGADFKESFKTPGVWEIGLEGYGEMLPMADNRVTLHKTKVDKWGMPQLHIDAKFGENDKKIRKAMREEAVKIMQAAGLKNITTYNTEDSLGLSIHEMGTARMGNDPREAVVNGYNQCHDVENVFITDGAAMASSACQNPSLTYMAFTARAADYAAKQMKIGKL
ncbi:GMC oxidoreductase [Pseudemcibacter aquimaris]|uniref:GMC oxidoreductase n=1 Tax=Pseudemcibacter aquimaris TaxID=2857064 RepID=UPI002012E4C7|nr:GMC family oxidoreductase [Pseudemcibacter aquimaris]MCC3860356.1 GMC family oxidoreductase [Pseudemcibacter aquimaris]WDU57682.1 GMC family oxidoreductase [Pseudemcibacter aquimaris]